jgi:hypothetical protein
MIYCQQELLPFDNNWKETLFRQEINILTNLFCHLNGHFVAYQWYIGDTNCTPPEIGNPSLGN